MRPDGRDQPPEIHLPRVQQHFAKGFRQRRARVRRFGAGRVFDGHDLRAAGNARVGLRGRLRQRFQKLAAQIHHRRAAFGQLRVPHVQRVRAGVPEGNLFQKRAALLERAAVALQRIIIGRAKLGKLHVHKPAALGGAVLHHAQILRRKQHAGDVPQQLAGARNDVARHLHAAALHAGQDDFHVVMPVPPVGVHAHAGDVRAGSNHFPVVTGAVRTSRAAQVDRLEDVRLSLRVVAGEHGNTAAGRDFGFGVIAEVRQTNGADAHTPPPFASYASERDAPSPKKRLDQFFLRASSFLRASVPRIFFRMRMDLGVISTSSSSSM